MRPRRWRIELCYDWVPWSKLWKPWKCHHHRLCGGDEDGENCHDASDDGVAAALDALNGTPARNDPVREMVPAFRHDSVSMMSALSKMLMIWKDDFC